MPAENSVSSDRARLLRSTPGRAPVGLFAAVFGQTIYRISCLPWEWLHHGGALEGGNPKGHFFPAVALKGRPIGWVASHQTVVGGEARPGLDAGGVGPRNTSPQHPRPYHIKAQCEACRHQLREIPSLALHLQASSVDQLLFSDTNHFLSPAQSLLHLNPVGIAKADLNRFLDRFSGFQDKHR